MPNEDVRKLALELSEKRLASQTAAALAADTRAMSLAGIMVAASAILVSFAENTPIPIATFVGALFLLGSGIVAARSARPIKFMMPGMNYSDFEEDLENDAPLEQVIEELGSHNDDSSRINDEVMEHNGELLKFSFRLAFAGIVVATLPQIVSETNPKIIYESALNGKLEEL